MLLRSIISSGDLSVITFTFFPFSSFRFFSFVLLTPIFWVFARLKDTSRATWSGCLAGIAYLVLFWIGSKFLSPWHFGLILTSSYILFWIETSIASIFLLQPLLSTVIVMFGLSSLKYTSLSSATLSLVSPESLKNNVLDLNA